MRVLSKEHHVIYNTEITVRRPATKDQRRLLLCGIQPNTCMELLELYVENVMEVDVDDYTLTRLPGRDAVLIHLNQPLATGPTWGSWLIDPFHKGVIVNRWHNTNYGSAAPFMY